MLLSDDVSYALVKPLVALFSQLSATSGNAATVEKQRVDALIEIISDIRMPITQLETTTVSRDEEEQRKLDLKVTSAHIPSAKRDGIIIAMNSAVPLTCVHYFHEYVKTCSFSVWNHT